MGIVIMVYGYYAFIPISIAATLIYNHMYERYKREKGYKNNYKGSYNFKGFYDGHFLKTIADYFIKFFAPGFQFEPIIDLLLFKSSAKVDFNREKLNKDIEWVDPNIIDSDFEIISEERVNQGDEEPDDRKEELAHEIIHSLDSGMEDEEKREYVQAVEEYMELYVQYCEKNNDLDSTNVSIGEENSNPHLK